MKKTKQTKQDKELEKAYDQGVFDGFKKAYNLAVDSIEEEATERVKNVYTLFFGKKKVNKNATKRSK